jgi:regulator of protease activity HflC (stomatin/prohibitin superfamily)
MADIKRVLFWRHLRGEPNFQIVHYQRGRQRRSGAGLSFWFMPLSASIAEIPLDDRELPFHFQGRSQDFQDVTAQGVITFRVSDPDALMRRVDFSIDLDEGAYTKEPLERLAQLITQLAQQFALDYIANTPVRQILAHGIEALRERIRTGLLADQELREMGIEIVSVRLASVKPSADLERALQMPTREAIQQKADEAGFSRRAQAVEKERAIQENELQNKIELARREETLIAQHGQNERKRAEEEIEAARLRAEAEAAQERLQAVTEAEGIRVVEEAKVAAERDRMQIYRDLPTPVIIGLAAQELAGKLQSIEHLTVSPELFGPLVTDLIRAGTKRLTEEADVQR